MKQTNQPSALPPGQADSRGAAETGPEGESQTPGGEARAFRVDWLHGRSALSLPPGLILLLARLVAVVFV